MKFSIIYLEWNERLNPKHTFIMEILTEWKGLFSPSCILLFELNSFKARCTLIRRYTPPKEVKHLLLLALLYLLTLMLYPGTLILIMRRI